MVDMDQFPLGIDAGDLRRIISQKPDRGVLEFNNDGIMQFASPEFLNLTGHTHNEIVGNSLKHFIDDDDFQSNIHKLVQGKIPLARFVSAWNNGNAAEPLFLSFKCYPAFHHENKIISAVKNASPLIHQSDNVPPQVYIENALQQMPGALWHYSLISKKFEYLSPAIEKIFGITSDEFASSPLARTHPDDQENLHHFLMDGFYSPRYIEFRHKFMDGRWKTIAGYKYTVTDKDGQERSIAGVFVEKQQSPLDFKAQSLQSSLTTLEGFTDERLIPSLKTIQTHHEILKRHYVTAIDRDGHEILESLGVATQRMSGLIDGLSQVLRFASHNFISESVNLNELFDSSLLPFYHESYHSVTLDVGPLPEVKADKENLLILFKQLINNAIQHNHNDPHIIVKGKPTKWGALISIQDNGIGIPNSSYNEVFEMGRRLDMSLPSSNGGIGLALSGLIVKKYGGKIWLRSKIGKGTTVYLLLPQP